MILEQPLATETKKQTFSAHMLEIVGGGYQNFQYLNTF